MSKLSVPTLEPGDTLTTAHTTQVVTDATTIISSLDAENLAPESICLRNLDGSEAPLARYIHRSQHTDSQTYATTTPTVISHGSSSTEWVLSPNVTCPPGTVIRAHLRCMIRSVSIDSDAVDKDMYFFRLNYTDNGVNFSPGPDWGFSLLVRNSGGTLTDDSPAIDTSEWDELNFYQYRHVDICQVYVVPNGTTLDLEKLFWTYHAQSNAHSIIIGAYAVSFMIYKG